MLDRLCILDDFARALGLPEPTVKEGYVRIYDIPERKLGELAEDVKRRLGLTHLRVVGELERPVKRVALEKQLERQQEMLESMQRTIETLTHRALPSPGGLKNRIRNLFRRRKDMENSDSS